MKSATGITHLIVNSPYDEPKHHWHYHRETQKFSLKGGRRPAGYVIASESSKAFDDPGRFIPIELVNQIRPRVKAWREGGYAGVSGITRRLLEHWNGSERYERQRLFFCQFEAMETIIWLTEAPASERVGITIPSDGGAFQRLCCKMATGSGKTVVMAMLVAWQVLNKVTYPHDDRFSKHIFIVAPGLTVKSRLQVLIPAGAGNYYDEFDVVPGGLRERLRQGKVVVRNWHILNWETDDKIKKKRSVDKRGAKSDEAYVREVLGDLAKVNNIEVARDVYDQMAPTWKGAKENLLAQVIRLVEKFITSPLLEINPPLFYRDEMKRRLMLTLNMARIVQHVFEQIRFGNTVTLEPVFDSNRPIRSTADMLPWFTGKPCMAANRSHINLCVVDSTWEAQAVYELDHNSAVAAWAKNDHLGFEIAYIYAGVFHKFRPDYLIRLAKGANLVLEIKGQNTPPDETKRRYLDEWVKAVNEHGGFGTWKAGLCLNPSDMPTVIHNAISA